MAASRLPSRPDPSRPNFSRLAREAEGYWIESRQPLASLVFITPLLVIFEVGILVLRVRNGAEVWIRQWLDLVGFGQHLLLPLLIVCILLAWHYTTRRPWRLSRGVFWGMAGECIVLAVCLRLLSQLQGILLGPTVADLRLDIFRVLFEKFRDAVGYLGAGIYEELLFRLILLSLVVWGLRRLRVERRPSMIAGVLLTSLLFSAAHYVGANGYDFDWYSFLFRFLAGVFFAILFVYRGFGIAAGTHAGYDILVGVLAR